MCGRGPYAGAMRESVQDRSRAAMKAAMIAAGIAACALALLIHRGIAPKRAAFDAMLYHEEVVRGFVAQWPDVNVFDYLSATTPGYHLLLAACAKLAGSTYSVLATAGSLWTLLLVGALAHACTKRSASVLVGVCLAMLVCMSSYVHWAGAAVLPDNAGWALVVLQALVAMHMLHVQAAGERLSTPQFGGYAMVFGALFLACVLVRQAHAWTAGLLIAAAWLCEGSHDTRRSRLAAFCMPSADRIARLTLALVALVPGLLVLALFVRLWGGLVPPRFASQYPEKALWDNVFSPAPVFVLAVCGLFAPFFAGLAAPGWAAWWREQRGLLVAVVLTCGALMCLPVTTYDFDAGRRTGLWNIAEKLPNLGHTSLFIVGLAILGLVVLLGLVRQLPRSERWILSLMLVGFACALSASSEIWQRYVEPLVLVVLALASARVLGQHAQEHAHAGRAPSRIMQLARTWAIVGPAVLALGLLAQSAITTARNPLDMRGPKPPTRDPVHRGITPPVELPPIPREGRTLWGG